MKNFLIEICLDFRLDEENWYETIDSLPFDVELSEDDALYENMMQADICTCTDSKKKDKKWYATRNDADNTRLSIERNKNITLNIYECPTTNGWHLTKV